MTAPLDPSPPPPKTKKRVIALSVFLVLLVIGGIGGFVYWLHASQFEETDDAFVDGNIVTVSPQIAGRVKNVNVRDNQDVAAGDLLVEIDSTDLTTSVSQSTAALRAAESKLEAARTNVELVKASSDAMLSQAKAGVENAQAAVDQAQATADKARAEIEQAQATVQWAQAQAQSGQADVDAAQAEVTRRQADLKRYDAVDPRAMSQQQRDAARAASDSAAAQLNAAVKRKAADDAQVAQEQSKLAEAKASLAEELAAVEGAKSRVSQARGVLQSAQTAPQQIASSQAQANTAQAAVEQAQADLKAAEQQVIYTRIVAPVSGRITRKAIQVGQYVDAGRSLLSIVESDVWVTANFKETQLARMHIGQKVDITVDTYPGRTFEGRVESIQAGTGARFSLMPPENATGNFVKVVQRVPVKITFENDPAAKQLLGPGMSAVPRVHVGGDEGTPAPIAMAPGGGPVDAKQEVSKNTK